MDTQSTHLAAVELVSLTKQYGPGAVAVDAINLRIAANSYCCLLGPSGCGKSTTLRMIAGHESVSSGDILLESRNITTLRGLDPAATPQEIEAGARQYVRKISGVQQTSTTTEEPFFWLVTRA